MTEHVFQHVHARRQHVARLRNFSWLQATVKRRPPPRPQTKGLPHPEHCTLAAGITRTPHHQRHRATPSSDELSRPSSC
jgi:hypothetical protein